MSVIEVEDLSFSYNSTLVLKKVSFTVLPGDFIGVFGPNGGGKTTLLNLLMGFLKPTGGKISLFGSPPKRGRKKIGWVPQTFHFDRSFPISVEEVVLSGRLSHATWYGRFYKEDRAIVAKVLEKVGMRRYLRFPFAALSGGQAQRVLIARALASNPLLLLLDEPISSLDFDMQKEIYKLLRELKKEMTILMVTHDLSSLIDQADRFFCIQGTLTSMPLEKLCEHFALGLYHAPLKTEDS